MLRGEKDFSLTEFFRKEIDREILEELLKHAPTGPSLYDLPVTRKLWYLPHHSILVVEGRLKKVEKPYLY